MTEISTQPGIFCVKVCVRSHKELKYGRTCRNLRLGSSRKTSHGNAANEEPRIPFALVMGVSIFVIHWSMMRLLRTIIEADYWCWKAVTNYPEKRRQIGDALVTKPLFRVFLRVFGQYLRAEDAGFWGLKYRKTGKLSPIENTSENGAKHWGERVWCDF